MIVHGQGHLQRGSPYTALTGKVWVFWIGGCLWEVVAYEGWSHKEVLLYSLYHLPPCSFLPSHSDTPHPTKKCGMIRLTPWQKLLFFYCFSNSWSLMSHCYKVKFLLNRPTSVCIKSRYWQRGLWGIHKCKTKEIILRLRNE